MNQTMLEDARTLLVGAAGLAAQYADFDFVIKLLVGVATLTYLVIRIVKALLGDKSKDE